MSATLAGALPVAWRGDRYLSAIGARWACARVLGDEDGVLLVLEHDDGGPSLAGRGDPRTVGRLLASLHDPSPRWSAPAHWLSVPRGTPVDRAQLDALGLEPFSTWDWMSTASAPAPQAGEAVVRPLDREREAEAARACLRVANPSTTADPTGPDEAGWWAVERDGAVVGVIGARREPGTRAGEQSWHLHGLGVLPTARRTGAGAALTAAATRGALEAGAEFVSLGMYADNDGARRIYRRLGFRTDAENASYGPVGTVRPPD
ncbi:GNAT family N-acetyltransferase [Cellulomonas massiliensis]|uniref:GNAT family N-acetyltransferase n=1 Tax=Cellulomonas massiliensis TaxID=1465811 RepID=UPI00030E9E52|nr:GNAT family N-acetyltransferase [Cellulomonas massiliensis]